MKLETITNTSLKTPHMLTRQAHVGDVLIGGGAAIAVQSMCTTNTADAEATLAQINNLADHGCELIRVAVPHKQALDGLVRICEESPIPVIADIHFDANLALGALERGVNAVRINPGNMRSFDDVDRVIDAAGQADAAIRIGVNAGSLDPDIAGDASLTQVEKLCKSAEMYVNHFEERGFYNIVVSAKAHDVQTTIDVNRALSAALPEIPLHLGVTEAGTVMQGTVKNAVALGILLNEGIGDTFRISLTADPVEEVIAGWNLLAALNLRRRTPELVSCPTCGRCQVNLIGLAQEVEKHLQTLSLPISVAVMGCIVNGPGEARGADIGVACGRGRGMIFAGGEQIRTVDESEIVDELFREIDARFGEHS